ncbi:MAG: hypothetical protein JNK05_17810 [Myxococcales bacterium]|nr:hypothetical protein [Myxococcales bacterium]
MKQHLPLALALVVGCSRSQPPDASASTRDATPSAVIDAHAGARVDAGPEPSADASVDAAVVDAPPIDESQFAALNRGAIGRGRGFWCYDETPRAGGERISMCDRSRSFCATRRRSSVDRGMVATECASTPRAWCYTMVSTGYGSLTIPVCANESAGYAQCVAARAATMDGNRRFVRYRNLSRCELVE